MTDTVWPEEGKFYMTREGRKVGPMRIGRASLRAWVARKAQGDDAEWTLEGKMAMPGPEGYGDLIAEWTDADDAPQTTNTREDGEFGDGVTVSLPSERLDALNPAQTLTGERKNTHGDWLEQSRHANELHAHFRELPNWADLTASQQEALDMIATKISRIGCGDPNAPDHWDDIAGYAYLGKSGHAPA